MITRPTMLMDFVNSRQLDPRFSVVRSQAAPYFDSKGVRRSAAAGQPRIDFDPVTHECRGLLLEDSRTNLLTYCDDYSNAVWTATNATITANAANGPEGTAAWDKVTESAVSGMHGVYRTSSVTIVNGSRYTWTQEMQAAGRNYVAMVMTSGAAGQPYAIFDLSAGVMNICADVVAAKIENLGGGRYRCSMTFDANGTSWGGYVRSLLTNYDINQTWLGDGASGIYLGPSQLELGGNSTTPILTTSATVTRPAEYLISSGADFLTFHNMAEGCYFGAFHASEWAVNYENVMVVSDNTISNYMSIVESTSNYSLLTNNGGVSQGTVSQGVVSQGVNASFAFGYSSGNAMALSINGGVANVGANSNPTIPTVSQLIVGLNAAASGNGLSGHVRELGYMNRRPTNGELQTISGGM